jgi:hypothetical protein
VFGVAVLASVFAAHGGYLSGPEFVHGLRAAVAVGAGVVAVAAAVMLTVPGRRSPESDLPGAGEGAGSDAGVGAVPVTV